MLYVHITGQVCRCLLQTSMHSWHLHHRCQQQHNLTSRHACVHLAHAALHAWWCVWQQPTQGDGFDFELLTKLMAPPTPMAPSRQLTLRHSRWGAATQDIALTTPTCHTPAHHRQHTPCMPATHMLQHEDALSVCKTALCGTAWLTSPSTLTPPTPHDNAIMACAKADKAAADQSILKQLTQLYEDSYGPSTSTTTDACAHTRQQETVVQQLKHDMTDAEAAVNANTDPSSPATTPGTLVSQPYRNALSACTAADRAGADLLTAQLCANNKCEVGG